MEYSMDRILANSCFFCIYIRPVLKFISLHIGYNYLYTNLGMGSFAL